MSRTCLLSAAAVLAGQMALAQPAIAQALAPAHPSTIRVLPPAEHDLFARAFAAAARGDWTNARVLAAQSRDTVARGLIEWRYALDRNSGATFDEIQAVMKAAAGWPLPGTLQARAEQAMPPDMPPDQVIAWFGSRDPNSSIGKIRLGEALVATGAPSSTISARGARLIREGWAEGSFDPPVEQAIIQKDTVWLTPDSEKSRLDALLWRSEVTAARRQIARVDARTADIALARIALDGGLARARAALSRVQGVDDPDLLFDWSRALRVAKRDGEAHAMLLRAPAAELAKNHAARWWTECAIQARDALKAGEPRLAYRLIIHAGLSSGEPYAEQQFLAGFIALRFLKEPAAALTHFQNLAAAVARPISLARARYWQGRAYEAAGDIANALIQYRQAAALPETFYGQLALAKSDPAPVLRLTETQADTAPAVELDGDLLMPQIKILADLGQEASLRLFIDRDLESNTSPGHARRLMLSLINWGYPEIAVRVAKSQSYAGNFFPDLLYPTLPLPAYRGPGDAPEPALVLGLIRQETEFDPYAVSGAGAQGLMQLMPASARAAAQYSGLPWRPGQVMSDTAYNIQLGMAEFAGHMNRSGGSLVLSIAAYNAGPANVKKWIDANGDPRTGTDPIDWIELIPFGETRNYVQRVLENAGVYRSRLAGRETPLRIASDLYAPGTPPAAMLRVSGK